MAGAIARFAFETGRRRRPGGFLGGVIKGFAALTAVWTVYAAAFSTEDVLTLTITFLSLMLVLTFLLIGHGPRADAERVDWFDWRDHCRDGEAPDLFANGAE